MTRPRTGRFENHPDLEYQLEEDGSVTIIGNPRHAVFYERIVQDVLVCGGIARAFGSGFVTFGGAVHPQTLEVHPIRLAGHPGLTDLQPKEYRKLAKENQALREYRKLAKENQALRELHELLQKEVEDKIKSIERDYESASHVRRLQVQAVPYQDGEVEGLTHQRWVLEDSEYKVRYLVVGYYAEGTDSTLLREWAASLLHQMENRFGEGSVYVVLPPKGTAVQVLEVLPGVNYNEFGEVEEDQCQF